ncbi:hypothetical protein [Pedobacter sp. GR22-6]|uniref:hypothetical protein n=1 Tax=Pedobacter sp. GR22-6 TaxID=3127957 RepID=UPI00307F6653
MAKVCLGHLADFKFFNENEDMDEMGNTMIMKHVEEMGNLTTELWNDLLEGSLILLMILLWICRISVTQMSWTTGLFFQN